MTLRIHLDANVLIYAEDTSDRVKQKQAAAWIAALWRSGAGRVSSQVLNEFFSVVTQYMQPGLKSAEAAAIVERYEQWRPHPTNGELFVRARPIFDRYGFSWWDSLIVAAAIEQSCSYLLTEDLQHNQKIGSLTIISPFQSAPQALFSQ